MKIVDKMAAYKAEGKAYFSFEFFPPRTERAQKNLQVRIENLSETSPLFVSMTCSNGQHDVTLKLCRIIHKFCGIEVLMHVTCVGRSRESVREILQSAKDSGISNVLALRGDTPTGKESYTQEHPEQFQNATELVQFIRAEFGDHFCIGVSGYPEGRLNYKDELKILKEKIECGADFVITQLFFQNAVFYQFKRDCKTMGITVPIIPGIFPIQGYSQFQKVTKYLKVEVPERIKKGLEPIKSDDAKVKTFGIDQAAKMSEELLRIKACDGIHMYTLNLERSARSIIKELDYYFKLSESHRPLPWKPSVEDKRSLEDVRPIFWANRPKSYVARTHEWDEFPNGRWGDMTSPAFRDVDETHFYMRGALLGGDKERKKAWGEAPLTEQDIYEVFAKYIDGKVKFLPWCESALHLETSMIKDKLLKINRAGFLTINSQPRVNAASSSDSSFGWGPPNGHVYQKAYIEFFASPNNLSKIMSKCKADKFSSLTYHAIDVKGNSYSNCKTGKAAAVC